MSDPNSITDIDAGRLAKEDLAKGSIVGQGSVLIRWLAWLILTATPALATAVLIQCLGVSLDSFTPATSDEIGYYLQVNAFVHYGFSGGYFTIAERPAPAHFSHFGVHGPLFPVLYGAMGKLVGWDFRTAPWINIFLLTIAIAVYCVVIRPTVWQALLGTLFLATFWPFYLCILSVLQDPVHWAIAVLVATGFCGMLRGHAWAETWPFRFLFLGLLVYASLMRISWAMFLIPYMLLQLKQPSPRRLGLALLASAAGIVLLLYAFRWLCAPYVGDPRAFLMNKLVGGEVSLRRLFNQISVNLEQLFWNDLSFQPTQMAGALIFWEAIAFGCLSVVSLFVAWLGHRETGPPTGRTMNLKPPTREVLFHAFNIWALLAGIILFYFVGNDGGWRMLSVHLLVSAFIAITSVVRWVKVAMIAMVLINLGGLPWCTESIWSTNGPRFHFAAHIRELQRTLGEIIQYREGADPWQNTLLVGPYPLELVALPAGIGVSYYGDKPEAVALPIKSRYVLANHTTVKQRHWTLEEILRIRLPFSASFYLNPRTAPGAVSSVSQRGTGVGH